MHFNPIPILYGIFLYIDSDPPAIIGVNNKPGWLLLIIQTRRKDINSFDWIWFYV